jgi:hypothetical protein
MVLFLRAEPTRLVAAALIVLMAVGSMALWIAVPAACLYASSKLTSSSTDQFLVALPMTAAGMILFGSFLAWLNHLYLRVSGELARYEEEMEDFEPGAVPRLHGPLEPLLVGSLIIAVIALFVWFFAFAKNPPYVPL